MKLILSTSNIMSSGPVVRRPLFSKSNIELINSLRSNFTLYQLSSPHASSDSPATASTTQDYTSWTTTDSDTLYIPTWRPTPLLEPRDSYDVTAKLFFLPSIPASRRCAHTLEAIDLVRKELGVDRIDLLIVSYPGVSFDADDEEDGSADEADAEARSANSDESEGLDAQIQTWRVLETLQQQGIIGQLGLSEFSSARLSKFLPEVTVRPSVDQINVKDCCVVPKSLIVYAKENKIDLLTHADCMDILPPGTTRELLGPGKEGAGILAVKPDADDGEKGLKGDIEPQWVIKYTAVVKDRGVVENKGYFAVAQLGSCVEKAAGAQAA